MSTLRAKVREHRTLQENVPRQSATADALKRKRGTRISCPEAVEAVRSINACAKRRDAAGALALWRDYRQGGLRHVAVDTAALDACGNAIDFDPAWEIWGSMGEKDVIAYDAMIKCCAAAMKQDVAETLWKEMHRSGIRPSVISFTMMMTVHANTSNPDRAIEIFRELQAACTPDARAFAVVMSAVARAGDYPRTRKLFMQMATYKIPPNRHHFNCLITSCIKLGHAEQAEIAFQAMPAQNIQPDVRDFGALMACYCTVKNVDRCRELLQDMKDRTVQPNEVTFEQAIQAEALTGNRKRARSLLKDFQSEFGQLSPRLNEVARRFKLHK